MKNMEEIASHSRKIKVAWRPKSNGCKKHGKPRGGRRNLVHYLWNARYLRHTLNLKRDSFRRNENNWKKFVIFKTIECSKRNTS